MKELVGKMLDFTCSELGRGVSVSPQPVNMGELCRAIVEEAESAHPRRSMRLDCVGDLGGVWDPVRTTQAISNLVGNAIKHSATDVLIQADGSDRALVRVSVHNGGEPIPNHELPKLFEPFRQGTRTGSGEGLGLGLYIVQEIVSAHGGCIEARSSAAEGTSFLTVWPRTPASGRHD
jgi:signal transduction histidine kinase